MSAAERQHNVAVRVGGELVERWEEYSIECDMLNPADGFRVTLGDWSKRVFDLVRPDAPVEILLDGTRVLSGFVDDREWVTSREGTMLSVTGRDRGGRLVDESAPLVTYAGLGIQDLAEKLTSYWFPGGVLLDNATNRRLVRGRGAALAKVSKEPAIIATKHAPRKVNPGESIWHVLQTFLAEAELLGWSDAAGEHLIVGKPNYDQEAQFAFFVPKDGSAQRDRGNVLSCSVKDSTGERYSKIVACGAGRGDSADYGDRVLKWRGTALNNPDDADGVGKDFSARKLLLVTDDDLTGAGPAAVRAAREMAERDAGGRALALTVAGHAQLRSGRVPTLYAFDTMAHVEIEALEHQGLYLITAVSFKHSRSGGEVTELKLVPKGTELRV